MDSQDEEVNTESGQKRGWDEHENDGNVDGGRGTDRSNSCGSGRGKDDSGMPHDNDRVSSSSTGVDNSDNDGHQQFNDDIHHRRASAPTVIHYSDFDDEDVVVVSNMGGGSGHGSSQVSNPLWINTNDSPL